MSLDITCIRYMIGWGRSRSYNSYEGDGSICIGAGAFREWRKTNGPESRQLLSF